jgi:hypothetical protein
LATKLLRLISTPELQAQYPVSPSTWFSKKNKSMWKTPFLEFIDDVTRNIENSVQTDVLIMDF